MSSAAASSVSASHSGVLATPVKSKVDQLFGVLGTIGKVSQKIIAFLAMIFSLYYSSELIDGLIAIGIPVVPSVIFWAVITHLFIDYMGKKESSSWD